MLFLSTLNENIQNYLNNFKDIIVYVAGNDAAQDHRAGAMLDEKVETEYIEEMYDKLSRDMRFPTMWYVRPAKAQTSLRIRAV